MRHTSGRNLFSGLMAAGAGCARSPETVGSTPSFAEPAGRLLPEKGTKERLSPISRQLTAWQSVALQQAAGDAGFACAHCASSSRYVAKPAPHAQTTPRQCRLPLCRLPPIVRREGGCTPAVPSLPHSIRTASAPAPTFGRQASAVARSDASVSRRLSSYDSYATRWQMVTAAAP